MPLSVRLSFYTIFILFIVKLIVVVIVLFINVIIRFFVIIFLYFIYFAWKSYRKVCCIYLYWGILVVFNIWIYIINWRCLLAIQMKKFLDNRLILFNLHIHFIQKFNSFFTWLFLKQNLLYIQRYLHFVALIIIIYNFKSLQYTYFKFILNFNHFDFLYFYWNTYSDYICISSPHSIIYSTMKLSNTKK